MPPAPPSLTACRVRFSFRCDPPLDGSVFPGPALRGLIGRRLEAVSSPEGLAFLRERFRPGGSHGDAPAKWRLGFAEPPDPESGVFEVEVCAFGPAARSDLAAVAGCLAAPGLPLRLPGLETAMSLLRCSEPEESKLMIPAPENGELAKDASSGSCEIRLLTPLLVNRNGKRLAAAALAQDVQPLFDSLRLRFADLAGLRRNDPAVPRLQDLGVSAWPAASNLYDVRLPFVFSGRPETLVGILGSLRFEGLAPAARRILENAVWTGAGRQTSFGAGTLHVSLAPRDLASDAAIPRAMMGDGRGTGIRN